MAKTKSDFTYVIGLEGGVEEGPHRSEHPLASTSIFNIRQRNDAGMVGMPNAADLPSTFSVDYVRAWTKKENLSPK